MLIFVSKLRKYPHYVFVLTRNRRVLWFCHYQWTPNTGGCSENFPLKASIFSIPIPVWTYSSALDFSRKPHAGNSARHQTHPQSKSSVLSRDSWIPCFNFSASAERNRFRPVRFNFIGRARAMQSQLMCSSCRSILLYPRGATNVCCAICRAITSVPPPGMEMAQLICGGCRTLLMYTRGATSVRCSCCHTVNLAPASSQVAHVNCGNCRTTLMYPYGAPSVKCAICQYVTNVGTSDSRVPVPRPNEIGVSASTPTSSAMPHSQNQTVVVENPMSVDESGRLVSNVVVGVTKDKK